MKKHISLMLRSLAVSGILAVSLFSSIQPAGAAGGSYVVNGAGTNCLGGPTAYSSIQTAIDNAKINHVKTILVCPGDYPEPFSIDGVSGLKITAASLNDPSTYPVIMPELHSDGGAVITIKNGSTGIVLDHLIINGSNFSDAGSTMAGVSVVASSATIQYTTIFNVRNTTLDDTPGYGVLALDNDDNGKSSSVSLLHDYIVDFQTTGVQVLGAVKLIVSDTNVDGANGTVDERVYGIVVQGTPLGAPAGLISRSRVRGVYGAAIRLYETNKFSVTGSTTEIGIKVETDCSFAGATASGNKISGNTVTRDIVIRALISGNTVDGCNPTAVGNLVSGNIITSPGRSPTYAVGVLSSMPSGGHTVQLTGTKITKNQVYGHLYLFETTGTATSPTISGNVLIH